jgi:hypothetical protein
LRYASLRTGLLAVSGVTCQLIAWQLEEWLVEGPVDIVKPGAVVLEHFMQLDTRSDLIDIQDYLLELTGARSVPRVGTFA